MLCAACWGCVCVVVIILAILAAVVLPGGRQLRRSYEVNNFCGLDYDDAKYKCSESTRCGPCPDF